MVKADAQSEDYGFHRMRTASRHALIAVAVASTAGPVHAADDDATSEPAAAPEPPSPPATLWQPGNSTTSPVEPHVETDEGPPTRGRDGAYGRFEGDVDLGISLGAQIDDQGPSAVAVLSAHYYWMAGVTATYVDALGREDAGASRLIAVGVDARPAFVPRWGENHEYGPAFTDLLIDSISVGLGVFWASDVGGSLGDQQGFEASAGFGVPLFAQAQGLWLEPRGLLRWADPSTDDDTAVPALMVSLTWHQALQAP